MQRSAFVGLLVVAVLIAAPTQASAADSYPCGAQTSRSYGGTITTQTCPIYIPDRLGYVPVHAFAPNATAVGKLVQGGSANWFLCHARGPSYREGSYSNVYWALTQSDTGRRGWTSEVYFSGGSNDEADGGLRGCGVQDLAWARTGGAGVPGGSTPPTTQPPPRPPVVYGPYNVLQINMCNSGTQDCYSGRARSRAGDLINARRPSVVTLNEACYADLADLRKTTGYDGVFVGSGVKCRNGSSYGNMLLFPRGVGFRRVYREPYADAAQDPCKEKEKPCEKRTLACAKASGVTACVTHLGLERQRKQAAEMKEVVGRFASQGPTVLGGDWNITYPDAQRYVPSGMFRKGDDDVQHIMATTGFRFDRTRKMDLDWTDHPALQLYLTR